MSYKSLTITLFIILIFILYLFYSYIPGHMVDYDRSGLVTNKWTELSLGTTKYILEVNNTWTDYVDDIEWHNIEIGDTYNFTETIWE